MFILGDFNIDYSNSTSLGYKDIKWFEQRTGLQQLISTPTRLSTVNIRIDLIFSNCKYIIHSGVADVNISDHQAIFMTRKHTSKIKKNAEFTGRSYIDFDENLFCYDMIEIYEIDDVNISWNHFMSNISRTIDIMYPQRTFNIRNLKDPWITNEILENIHDKDVLLRQDMRTIGN